MKTKKLNKKTMIDGVLLVGGLVAGVMVSGAVNAVVPTETRNVARIGMTGLGTVGAALLPSTDNTSAVLRAMSAGMASAQGYGLISDQLKTRITVKSDAALAEKAMYGAVGLACACDDQYSPLRNPVSFPQLPVTTLDTTWDEEQESFTVEQNAFAV